MNILVFSKKTQTITDVIILVISSLLIFSKINDILNIKYYLLVIFLLILIFIRFIVSVFATIKIKNQVMFLNYLFFKVEIDISSILNITYELSPIDVKGLGIGLKLYNKKWYLIPQLPHKGIKIESPKKTIVIYSSNEVEYIELKNIISSNINLS